MHRAFPPYEFAYALSNYYFWQMIYCIRNTCKYIVSPQYGFAYELLNEHFGQMIYRIRNECRHRAFLRMSSHMGGKISNHFFTNCAFFLA